MGRLISLTAALGTVALVGLSSPAVADPVGSPRSEIIELDCDGTIYLAAINGNGRWDPALDVDSNSVLVPVWFSEVTGIATDSEGNSFELFSEPAMTKGSGRNADVDCTFTDSFSFTDPEAGLLTVVVTGEVKGFITARN